MDTFWAKVLLVLHFCALKEGGQELLCRFRPERGEPQMHNSFPGEQFVCSVFKEVKGKPANSYLLSVWGGKKPQRFFWGKRGVRPGIFKENCQDVRDFHFMILHSSKSSLCLNIHTKVSTDVRAACTHLVVRVTVLWRHDKQRIWSEVATGSTCDQSNYTSHKKTSEQAPWPRSRTLPIWFSTKSKKRAHIIWIMA